MQSLTIGPYSHASGTVALPGSKSISNRVLLLSALAHGTTNVRGLLAADDTQVMLNALHTLGVAMEQDGDQVTMHADYVHWHARLSATHDFAQRDRCDTPDTGTR